MTDSKPLGHEDVSGFEMTKRLLQGDKTFAVNFDRLLYEKSSNTFIVIEYQNIIVRDGGAYTPWTAHPQHFWKDCRHKYVALWRMVERVNGELYVINYSTVKPWDDQFRIIRIRGLGEEMIGDWEEISDRWGFKETSDWFRWMNRRGQ